MKKMSKLIFHDDSSEHGSWWGKEWVQCLTIKRSNSHTPFKSKPQPKVKLVFTLCKTRRCLCEWDFLRGGQCNPLWAAIAAASTGSALAAYLLKREREKPFSWWTFLPWHYQGLIHTGVKGSKIYSVFLIASLHLPWKPENRWSSDFHFPLW